VVANLLYLSHYLLRNLSRDEKNKKTPMSILWFGLVVNIKSKAIEINTHRLLTLSSLFYDLMASRSVYVLLAVRCING